MTLPSSDKPIKRNIQQYREIDDPYCEKGLISILFLSCGRHVITKKCLESLLGSIDKSFRNYELEFIFLEQGEDWNESSKNLELYDHWRFDRKVIVWSRHNYGIANGNNQLWQLSRGEYCLFLENDWFIREHNCSWLAFAQLILNDNHDIGLVQLRAIDDPYENWGYGKNEYNPFSIKNNKDKGFIYGS